MIQASHLGVPLNTRRITRPLYIWEASLARMIFGRALQISNIRIHELAAWPDTIDDWGRKLKGIPPRQPSAHNAITLGNAIFFPVGMPVDQPERDDPEWYKLPWLIHELTHCWQFQTIGLGYIWLALQAQFREKANVYDFGGASNLHNMRNQGWNIKNFNLEQQGNITQAFFCASLDLPNQQDLYAACRPFIEDIQT